MTNLKVVLCIAANLVITQNVYAKKSPEVLNSLVNLARSEIRVERKEMPAPGGRPSNYRYTEIQLDSKATGRFRLFEKTPKTQNPKGLLTVFMMSGLGASREAIYLVPDAPNVRVLSYQYPLDELDLSHLDAEKTGTAILRLPVQISASFLWLLSQNQEVDPNRIFSLNVSLGTFIAPYPLRALRDIGYSPAGTIFAFGGADLHPFLDARSFPIVTDPVKAEKVKKDLKEAINKHLNPRRNISKLVGPFLIINGTHDDLIPMESMQSLVDLLQAPKAIDELATGHINRDKPEIIQQTFSRVLSWLNRQAATQLVRTK